MKKILIVLAAVTTTGLSFAQPRMLVDTLFKPYFQFDYNDWVTSDPQHPLSVTTDRLYTDFYVARTDEWNRAPIFGDLVQYNYIEGGADVYGIAVWGWPGRSYLPVFPQDSLFLFDATPDSMVLKAQLLFNNLDSNALDSHISDTNDFPDRYNFPPSCSDPLNMRHVILMRWNYLFDKPIHVEDSFYVGASNYYPKYPYMYLDWMTDPLRESDSCPLPPSNEFWYGLMNTMHYGVVRYDDSCVMPFQKVKTRDYSNNPYAGSIGLSDLVKGDWQVDSIRTFFMIVPIVGIYDTSWIVDTPACLPVTGFNLLSHFGDIVTLRWNPDGEHDEYQVSYGPEGIDPDSGTIVTTFNSRWRFIDTVHNGTTMVGYVRTVCRELDTLRYSPWSEGVTWQTSYVDIKPPREGDRLAGGIRLMPNPARGEVTLMSNYRISSADIYRADGTKHASIITLPYTARFDVGDWPKGVYFVVVHTQLGDVAKKLVVE